MCDNVCMPGLAGLVIAVQFQEEFFSHVVWVSYMYMDFKSDALNKRNGNLHDQESVIVQCKDMVSFKAVHSLYKRNGNQHDKNLF